VKKSPIWTDHIATEALIMSLSKAALADVVIDLLRQAAGDDRLDGRRLAEAFLGAAEPTLRHRRDRIPALDTFWTASAEWAGLDPERAERWQQMRRDWEAA
jgi:hypothetical protein